MYLPGHVRFQLTSDDHHVNHFPPKLRLVVVELPLERQDVVGRADVVFGPLQDLSLSALARGIDTTARTRGRSRKKNTSDTSMSKTPSTIYWDVYTILRALFQPRGADEVAVALRRSSYRVIASY